MSGETEKDTTGASKSETRDKRQNPAPKPKLVQPEGEQGGPKGPEPTRYGDWEVGGRCTDF